MVVINPFPASGASMKAEEIRNLLVLGAKRVTYARKQQVRERKKESERERRHCRCGLSIVTF